MTIELIESFLAIIEHRTISGAAQALYVSQSTMSGRLAQLEAEVGAKLFERHRGQRSVELTQAGEEFVLVAERWMSLLRDTRAIAQGPARRTLTIGAPTLINTYTFVPAYRAFLAKRPDVQLVMRTYHSSEVYRKLVARVIDVGYVFSRLRFPDVVVRPLFREELCVLIAGESEWPERVNPRTLAADREVYLRWNAEYEIWHDRFWPAGRSVVQVDAGDQLPLYLTEAGRWAIAPESVARALEAQGSIRSFELTDAPAPLQCFEVRHRYPRPSAESLIEEFSAHVRAAWG